MKPELATDVVGVASHALFAVLDSWGSIAHDDKSGFMERFCPKACILTQVSWDSENMRFVYILDCGQHVADSVKITEWLEFLSANVKHTGGDESATPKQ
jgi:hypothetical protein